ncbi:MAG: AAA family ATPase [Candidatus Aenigmarchaeota archaeon]|nr:AAA family ATPase [Candidatus Aenigmarchaeota archaeon]
MLVIGLAGFAASGKTEIANYLKEKHSFKILEFSSVIEEEARKMKLIEGELSMEEKKRKLSEVGALIREYYKNEAIFAELLVKKILSENFDRVVIPGFRSVYEVETFRRAFGEKFLLIWVETDAKLRYERRKIQDQKFNLSFEEFLERDRKDSLRLGMDRLKSQANFTIFNNSSIDDLKKNIDEILENLKI